MTLFLSLFASLAVAQPAPDATPAPEASTPAAAPAAAPAAPAPAGEPLSAGAQQIVSAFSVRENVPDCAAAARGVADPGAAFVEITQKVQLPPWAPMLAATCTIDLHAAAQADALRGWVEGANTAGFAKLVVSRLGNLPDDLAYDLTKRVLKGPHRKSALMVLPGVRTEAVQRAWAEADAK